MSTEAKKEYQLGETSEIKRQLISTMVVLESCEVSNKHILKNGLIQYNHGQISPVLPELFSHSEVEISPQGMSFLIPSLYATLLHLLQVVFVCSSLLWCL